MVNQTSNMGSNANWGSNWGWWIVAIIVAIVITWWISYASYHNSNFYGTGNSYNQTGTTNPGAAGAGGSVTPNQGNTNTR